MVSSEEHGTGDSGTVLNHPPSRNLEMGILPVGGQSGGSHLESAGLHRNRGRLLGSLVKPAASRPEKTGATGKTGHISKEVSSWGIISSSSKTHTGGRALEWPLQRRKPPGHPHNPRRGKEAQLIYFQCWENQYKAAHRWIVGILKCPSRRQGRSKGVWSQ